MKEHSNKIVKAKEEVINKKILNSDHEELGKITEIMLEKISGKVVYAVLESDGFFGFGEKLFALPWNLLRYDPDKNAFIVDIEKKKFTDAPGFDPDHWPDMADEEWAIRVHEHYGSSHELP